jgi:hypothetical protein
LSIARPCRPPSSGSIPATASPPRCAISPPANAKPLQGLFQKLDINPIELLEAGSSGEGLGDLLESVIEGSSGGSSSGGSSSDSSGGGSQKAYLECLKDARTPTDLQKCASLIQ